MYVCLCRGITDSQIKQAVAEGAQSVREVNELLGTASQCGKCGLTTRDIVNQELNARQAAASLAYKAA
jgi:bacterioferritin-associated ferredoxin